MIEPLFPTGMNSQFYPAEIDLPCKLHRETKPDVEFPAVVVSIDPGDLLLQMAAPPVGFEIGDRVCVEVALPNDARMNSKCMHVRARLVNVGENQDGLWRLRLKVWKVRFADRLGPKPVKLRKKYAAGENK